MLSSGYLGASLAPWSASLRAAPRPSMIIVHGIDGSCRAVATSERIQRVRL
jgi:hypothetical protein